jgi:hypothetical protein
MNAKTTFVLGLLVWAVSCTAEAATTCQKWNELEKRDRLFFVIGFHEGFRQGVLTGVVQVAAELGRGAEEARDWGKGVLGTYSAPVTDGDTIKGISAICARPENSPVPVYDVVEAFIRQVNGESQSEIDASLAAARSRAIKRQDSDKPNR